VNAHPKIGEVRPGPRARAKLDEYLTDMHGLVAYGLEPDALQSVWIDVRMELMRRVEVPSTAAVRAAPHGTAEP